MNIYAGPSGLIRGQQLQSTAPQGTPPFTVVSTTKVANLNADEVDGRSPDTANTADAIVARDGSGNINVSAVNCTSVSASGAISGNTLSIAQGATINGQISAPGGIDGGTNFGLIDRVRMGRYVETFKDYGNVSGGTAINCSEGNNFRIRLTGSTSLSFNTVPVDNNDSNKDIYTLTLITENGGGGHGLSWPSSVKWPGGTVPARTTANGAQDVWVLITYDGGSNWYGSLSLINMS